MKIGLDISSLQGYHRMRGIGAVANNIIKNLPHDSDHTFVFYLYKDSPITGEEIMKSTHLPKDLYEFRDIVPNPKNNQQLPGRLRYISKAFKVRRLLNGFRFGSEKFINTQDLDAFIQLDQSEPMAKLRYGARNYFIGYDLIPYVLEHDYLKNYKSARLFGMSRRAALKTAIRRYLYIFKLRLNSKNAYKIFSISDTTKRDFVKYLRLNPKKVETIPLGIASVSAKPLAEIKDIEIVDRYHETLWGYITKKESLAGKKFLLFVGGVDSRRRLEDLVTAFNHLRAQGEDIKLVLTGDIMLGPKAITTDIASRALASSSYLDDVYFLGYISNELKEWLFAHALAFVFPSVYEGFGLPVLEVMAKHTPVISYENDAVKEIAQDYPIYANDALSIIDGVKYIEENTEEIHEKLDAASAYAAELTWKKTVESILSKIEN